MQRTKPHNRCEVWKPHLVDLGAMVLLIHRDIAPIAIAGEVVTLAGASLEHMLVSSVVVW